jgi:hypothetical protein
MTLVSIPQTTIQVNRQIVNPTREQANALRAAGVKFGMLIDGKVRLSRRCPTCDRLQPIDVPVVGDEGKRNIQRSVEIMTAADCPDCRPCLLAPVTRNSRGGGNGSSKSRKAHTVKVTRGRQVTKWMLRLAFLEAKVDALGLASLTQAEVKELSKLTARAAK